MQSDTNVRNLFLTNVLNATKEHPVTITARFFRRYISKGESVQSFCRNYGLQFTYETGFRHGLRFVRHQPMFTFFQSDEGEQEFELKNLDLL